MTIWQVLVVMVGVALLMVVGYAAQTVRDESRRREQAERAEAELQAALGAAARREDGLIQQVAQMERALQAKTLTVIMQTPVMRAPYGHIHLN